MNKADAIMNISKICFGYAKNYNVLCDCNASIFPNTITALLGPNGCGKTTLIKCMLNLLKPTSGEITINGLNIRHIPVVDIAKQISYVPQLASLTTDAIVRDYIVEGRTPYLGHFEVPGRNEYAFCEKYAEMLNITHIMGRHVSSLSGGQLQLVLIARAFVQDTPIIIMDEPLSALDIKSQIVTMNAIITTKNEGKSILFTTHDPNHAFSLNSSTWFLNDGYILAQGDAQEVLTKELLQTTYGQRVSLYELNETKVCAISKL